MNIKSFFKNLDWSFLSVLKVVWLLLLLVFWVWIIIWIISLMFGMLSSYNQYDYRDEYAWNPWIFSDDFEMNEGDNFKWKSKSIWRANLAQTSPELPLTAEDFEIKQHSATIRSSNVSKDCWEFLQLKSRKDIIVERSNVSQERCDFSFKINKEKSQEIVDFIKNFKPYYFNTNIYSIQQSVENLVSELSILEKKLKSTETTLLDAQSSYDELIILAKKKNDIESLTKLIDWKLKLINKLTQERQNINIRIIRIKKSQADQLDRLKYTFFNVNIYEDKIVNMKNIKESWNNKLKNLVNDLNKTLQWVSINLISYFMKFIEFAIYLFISLFFLKFLWFFIKKIWFIWKAK